MDLESYKLINWLVMNYNWEKAEAKLGLSWKSCAVCGWREAHRDIHHIVPLNEGGPDTVENKIPLCPNCHRMTHRGLILREELFKLKEL